MKKYSQYELATISMSVDDTLIHALENLFIENNITQIIETGTFLGLGSTTMLAKAIIKSKKQLPQFITIEVDAQSYKHAVRNLSSYPFITPKWGLSVASNEAKKFIENFIRYTNSYYPDFIWLVVIVILSPGVYTFWCNTCFSVMVNS